MMFRYFEWLILAFPLLGVLLNGFFGRRYPRRVQNVVACGAVLGALLIALPLGIGTAMEPGLVGKPEPLPWMRVWTGDQFLLGPLALRVDALSIVMVVTTLIVGLFIHLHAVRDMGESETSGRHLALALLNGLIAALLLLVLADNAMTLLLGWSLTGWCTCWLFRNRHLAGARHGGEQNAHRAGIVFGLIGDLCMLMAVGMMSKAFQTWAFDEILSFPSVEGVPVPGEISAAAILLLVSAAIRGAQFPFHSWLPDRKAGLADALLYGLTSVPASVYLLARLRPLFERVPFGLSLLSWWGAGSALLMALAALAQPDVRRLLRYMVISLGGSLFLTVGLGATSVALSFLPAYALAQVLIFVVAQEIPPSVVNRSRRSRRAQKRPPIDPVTRQAVVFGTAALAGFPLLPGFALGRGLLAAAYMENKWIWVLAVATWLLLAASAFRAAWKCLSHPAAESIRARGTLALLAFLCMLLGLANLSTPPPIGRFLESIVGPASAQPTWVWVLIAAGVVAAGAGLGAALRSRWQEPAAGVREWIASGYRVGDLYQAAVARPLLSVAAFVARVAEPQIARWTLGWAARLLDKAQPGRSPNDSVHLSLLFFFLGTAAVVAFLLIR